MELMTQWFSELSFRDPSMWVALASGLTVLLGFLFLGRRTPKPVPIIIRPESFGSADWDADVPMARHDERRRAIRRSGMPTAVQVISWKATRKTRPTDGYVLDRSSSGLRLAMENSFVAGDIVAIRPATAPSDFEWVKVLVRNCREVGDYFELGVEFETDVELSRLLMFG